MRNNNSAPLIEFYTSIEALTKIEEVQPQPASKFVPQWWKQMPKQDPFPAIQTVKVCPSFPDYFSQGFVVPMWADVMLKYDKHTSEWNWIAGLPSPTNPFSIETHLNAQFIDYIKPSIQGVEGNFIFKFNSPWSLKTPKGYSVLQLPMFYHFNKEFSVLPGVIHTDFHTTINQQVVYHGTENEIFIKRGTPLVHYIPFERKKYGLKVRVTNLEDKKRDDETVLSRISKFLGSGAYNSDRKQREK